MASAGISSLNHSNSLSESPPICPPSRRPAGRSASPRCSTGQLLNSDQFSVARVRPIGLADLHAGPAPDQRPNVMRAKANMLTPPLTQVKRGTSAGASGSKRRASWGKRDWPNTTRAASSGNLGVKFLEVRSDLCDDLLGDQHPCGSRLDVRDELALKVGLGLILEDCLLDSADKLTQIRLVAVRCSTRIWVHLLISDFWPFRSCILNLIFLKIQKKRDKLGDLFTRMPLQLAQVFSENHTL